MPKETMEDDACLYTAQVVFAAVSYSLHRKFRQDKKKKKWSPLLSSSFELEIVFVLIAGRRKTNFSRSKHKSI